MSVFDTLNQINVNDKTEAKNGLTYLSWAWAWAEVKKVYPDADYTIKKFGDAQLPYVYDENTGYMVFTDVTIEGQTHEMWLCVMDGANKAMKSAPYTYTVKNGNYKYAKFNTEDGKFYDKYGNEQHEFIEKTVEAATMFDINKTIMRCLVKNLAMFGLGLYIYAGEDLPEEVKSEPIICEDCGAVINPAKTKDGILTPLEIKQRSEEKFGKCICFNCAKKQPKAETDGKN
jgi:hypothetical protein